MKELDFLMIYEHKVRELENLCLLKYELENRGYSVKIMHIEDKEANMAVKPLYHAKVVILMACYRNSTLEWHTKNFVKFDKVIDMQWENIVYPKDENNPAVFKNYTGIGKEVVRVSWGEENRRRMLNIVHMDPKKVKLIGHVGMDFLRDELKGYYLNKNQLFLEYGLDVNKKVILFASPFYADNLSDDYINDMCSRFGEDWRVYYSFMKKSEIEILHWMDKLCSSRNDVLVIYRPHPGHIGKKMNEVAQKHANFKIISDKSIKQWIIVSDKIYTGNSSTFVEAFFAKKMCDFLFPYPVTPGFELGIIKNAKQIQTYQEFYHSIDEKEEQFSVPEKDIDYVYTVDWKVPSYVKFADMAEDVLADPYYLLTKKQLSSYRAKQPLKIRIEKKISRITIGYKLYLKILSDNRIHGSWIDGQRKIRQGVDEIAEKESIEATSEKEINEIIKRIRTTLTSENGAFLLSNK